MDSDEVLMLADEDGNYYEIPREVVEQHKVSEERKAEIEAATRDEVSGYSYDTYFIKEQIAAYRQADMQELGSRERMLKSAHPAEDGPDEEKSARPRVLLGAFLRKLTTRTA